MGRGIIAAGVILIAVGAMLHFAPGLIAWFGRLPGDVRFYSGRTRVFIPIASMVILSLALTLLINLLKR
jgi:hypothetical protein